LIEQCLKSPPTQYRLSVLVETLTLLNQSITSREQLHSDAFHSSLFFIVLAHHSILTVSCLGRRSSHLGGGVQGF